MNKSVVILLMLISLAAFAEDEMAIDGDSNPAKDAISTPKPVSGSAKASKEGGQTTQKSDSKAKKQIKLNFESEMVNGSVDNPSVEMVYRKKDTNFKKFINLREDFVEKVEQNKGEFNGQK